MSISPLNQDLGPVRFFADSGVSAAILQFAEIDGKAPCAPLEHMLARLPGIDRLNLICELATSARPAHRLALAQALSGGFISVGVPSVLAVLSVDEDPQVCAAARVSRGHAGG